MEPTINESPNEGSFLPQSHVQTPPGAVNVANQNFSAPVTTKGCEDFTNIIPLLTVLAINVNGSPNEGSFVPQSNAPTLPGGAS
eukprot:4362997-Ditylum_brightwellii.AAC.1